MRPRTYVDLASEKDKKYHKQPYELGLDEFGGCGQSHDHDDRGHVFPMSEADMRTLRIQLDKLLEG